jgi:hypothetical protein
VSDASIIFCSTCTLRVSTLVVVFLRPDWLSDVVPTSTCGSPDFLPNGGNSALSFDLTMARNQWPGKSLPNLERAFIIDSRSVLCSKILTAACFTVGVDCFKYSMYCTLSAHHVDQLTMARSWTAHGISIKDTYHAIHGMVIQDTVLDHCCTRFACRYWLFLVVLTALSWSFLSVNHHGSWPWRALTCRSIHDLRIGRRLVNV